MGTTKQVVIDIKHKLKGFTYRHSATNNGWPHITTDIGLGNMDKGIILNVGFWANTNAIDISCIKSKFSCFVRNR